MQWRLLPAVERKIHTRKLKQKGLQSVLDPLQLKWRKIPLMDFLEHTALKKLLWLTMWLTEQQPFQVLSKTMTSRRLRNRLTAKYCLNFEHETVCSDAFLVTVYSCNNFDVHLWHLAAKWWSEPFVHFFLLRKAFLWKLTCITYTI